MLIATIDFENLRSSYSSFLKNQMPSSKKTLDVAYESLGALLLARALESLRPGCLSNFNDEHGYNELDTPSKLPWFHDAEALADYLSSPNRGDFPYERYENAESTLELKDSGIIFWKTLSKKKQLALNGKRLTQASHIDLWDPLNRTLKRFDGRTMLGVPESERVEYALFWRLPRMAKDNLLKKEHLLLLD